MAIAPKEKELAAVGISVAAGCRPCFDFHFKKARAIGASDADIEQAIADALSVRRGAVEIMEAFAFAHLGRDTAEPAPETPERGGRMTGLVCIGAAFGVNCVPSLKAYLEAAAKAEISNEDIAEIVKLSAFIKGKAASHVEHLAERVEKADTEYARKIVAGP